MKRKYGGSQVPHKCVGVTVDAKRVSSLQNFSTRIVSAGQSEGWLTLTGDTITIKCDSGKNYIYDVNKRPGKYCQKCKHQTGLSTDQTGEQMRLHIATKHDGNGGYDVVNAYECKLRGEK